MSTNQGIFPLKPFGKSGLTLKSSKGRIDSAYQLFRKAGFWFDIEKGILSIKISGEASGDGVVWQKLPEEGCI